MFEALEFAALEDDDLHILECVQFLGDFWGEPTDLDFAEVHFLELSHLILVVFQSVLDINKCAHSDFI